MKNVAAQITYNSKKTSNMLATVSAGSVMFNATNNAISAVIGTNAISFRLANVILSLYHLSKRGLSVPARQIMRYKQRHPPL
jgi:hypothetical protein